MSNTMTRDADALELKLEREYAHPVDVVFRAWTDSEALRHWMGPGEITAPEAEIDAREGGGFTIPMVHVDGQVMTARGKILELVPDRKLRFTWVWDQEDGSPGQVMEITLDFFPSQTGTRLTFHQTDFIDAKACDQHEFGWTGSLDKLEGYLGS